MTIINKKNNFDLLRLLMALSVFFAHSALLTRSPQLRPLASVMNVTVAVDVFFVISGFLIFMSYERSTSLKDYFVKRFRRIYPAYFTVVVICAIFGVFFSKLSFREYFSSQWLDYLLANLSFLNFLQPYLPGAFIEQPYSAFVNGALWTIKVEVIFYFAVPLIAYFLSRYNRLLVIGIVYGGAILYSVVLTHIGESSGSVFYLKLEKQLPAQLAFFISGAALYYYIDFARKHSFKLLFAGLTGIALHKYFGLYFIYPASLAIITVYFAVFFIYIGNWGKFGDFSYGTYIWHFPVLQAYISVGMFNKSPYWGFILSMLTVLILAIISWYIIEKPFLKKSSHYRQVEMLHRVTIEK